MSALFSLVLALQAAATLPAMPMPPADWSTLPELALLRHRAPAAELGRYVRDEVRAGRCATSGTTLKLDVAVMIAANGQLRRIIPRAINCPRVEQYAAGLVSSIARGNVAAPGSDRWYHYAVMFAWQP